MRTGFAQLARLADSGRLDFRSPAGWVQNRHFRTGLFLDVLTDAGAVTTLAGQGIDVSGFCAIAARKRARQRFFMDGPSSAS